MNPTRHTQTNRNNRSRLAARVVGLAFGVCAFGSAASGQSVPAAKMLPARPVDESTLPVQRSATPEYATQGGFKFDVPGSVPAPVYGNGNRTAANPTWSRTAPPSPTVEKPKGVISGAMSSVKDLFGGKSADPKATEPTSPGATAVVYPLGGSVPNRVVQPSPQPAPGLYAGPPAYRWYGYGSPTPGANPYAPTGLSPKGSANWYSQTGATPGAFPVPVTGMPRLNGHEPPTYVGPMQFEDTHDLAGTRIPMYSTAPSSTGSATDTRVVAQTPFHRPHEPQMPSGGGWPVVGSVDPTAKTADVSWQPVATRPMPIATTPNTQPIIATPPPVDPSWAPSIRSLPGNNAPAPSVSMIRGQAPTEESVDVEMAIRSACFGRASGVSVTNVGIKKLHVKLVSPTESDARDAAAVVSRLPQFRTYTITFEATIAR